MQLIIGDFGRPLRLSGDLLTKQGKPQSSLTQSLCRPAALFAQQPKQKMLGANVPVFHALRFFRAIRQHAFRFVAEWKIDRCTGLRAFRGTNLRFDGSDCVLRSQ